MNRMKVYIETTVFNRYFESGLEYAVESNVLFKKVESGEIEAYTSTAVLEELDNAPEPKRSEMLELVSRFGIAAFEVDEGAYALADTYIEMGIIPARFRLDGVHIAMAALHDMDCIIRLNFHHINKLKTKTATEIVHRMRGLSNPFICTPAEVIYDDE